MPCRCLATCCWHGVPRRPDPAIPAIPEPCGDGKIDNSGPFFRMIRAGPMTAQFPSLSMPLMLTPPRRRLLGFAAVFLALSLLLAWWSGSLMRRSGLGGSEGRASHDDWECGVKGKEWTGAG